MANLEYRLSGKSYYTPDGRNFIFETTDGDMLHFSREDCLEMFLTLADAAPMPFDRDKLHRAIEEAFEKQDEWQRGFGDWVDVELSRGTA